MLLHGQCCFDAGIWVKELSNVPCIFLQKFFQIHLYTLHHSQSLHMYNCILHCSYLWCYPCPWVKLICSSKFDCDEEYIGESGRTFAERYKEHLKVPSPIFLHQNSTGHATTLNNFKIIAREENSLARTIRQSIYIRVNNPTLNRNIGKYNLPHIWDKILFSIPELKKK